MKLILKHAKKLEHLLTFFKNNERIDTFKHSCVLLSGLMKTQSSMCNDCGEYQRFSIRVELLHL